MPDLREHAQAMPLLQLHAPAGAGLRRAGGGRARRHQRVALPHLRRDLRRARTALNAAQLRATMHAAQPIEVGQRQQRQQQHPQHDRAPDQPDDAAQVAQLRRHAGRRAVGRRRSRAARRLRRSCDRSGVTPGAAAPPSCTPTAPAAAARMTPSLAMPPQPGVAPPAVDGLLEVADHGEAERGEPRRHVVDQRRTAAATAASGARWPATPSVRLLKRPVAAGELGHAVQHRARPARGRGPTAATNQKNTPNTWRCAASSECSMTWRSSSVRGSSLASRWRHSASSWRALRSRRRARAHRGCR